MPVHDVVVVGLILDRLRGRGYLKAAGCGSLGR